MRVKITLKGKLFCLQSVGQNVLWSKVNDFWVRIINHVISICDDTATNLKVYDFGLEDHTKVNSSKCISRAKAFNFFKFLINL